MATQHWMSGRISKRQLWYGVLAFLIVVPLVAFGIGPLTSSSFSLEGPAGPLLAFSAGVLSFVSPCVLPLVPIYITHLSGASIVKGKITADRRVTFAHAVAFVAGLSLVFIVLGTSVGLLGSYFFRDNQRDLERFAGVVLAVMGIVLVPAYGRRSPMKSGLLLLALTAAFYAIAQVADLRGDRPALAVLGALFLLAWLKFAGYVRFSFFSRTMGVNLGQDRAVGYSRSALVGGAFALGWTPCVGPILGSILTLAATSSHALTGTYLLVAYSAGFSVPFLITGLLLSDATAVLRKITPYTGFVEVASGIMLIGLGLLLWHGRLVGLNEFFGFAEFNQGL